MTGFIQRLLVRGTGKATQPSQATFRPRPRSRFEPVGEAGKEAGSVDGEMSVTEESGEVSSNSIEETSRRIKNQRQAGEHFKDQPQARPTRSRQGSEKNREQHELTQENAELTVPREDEKTVPVTNPPQVESSSSFRGNAEIKSVPTEMKIKDTSGETRKLNESEKLPGVEIKETGRFTRNSVPDVIEKQTDGKRQEIERQNHALTESNRVGEPSSFSESMEGVEKILENDPNEKEGVIRETDSSVLPGQDISERQRASERDLNQKPQPPEVTISIGRIQVEFVQPEPRPVQRSRPAIQRTSGFDGYGQARRGMRRR